MWLLFFCLPGHVVAAGKPGGPEHEYVPRRDLKEIQTVVDDLLSRMELHETVGVTIVPRNRLTVSVERKDEANGDFLLSIEEGFLEELNDEQIRAALAHELGHVWIFTHHPYLQTETLANQIARRVVTRDALVQVYEKLWKHRGTTGDLARLVGD
jgi:hypothetical protein